MSLDHYFDQLYAQTDDPYGLRTRWYEARKRALLMASLPRARYRHAYEPACGAAELTALLAERCDHLLASDANAAAVAAAQRRVGHLPNVQITHHRLPQDWPAAPGEFDLIVLSEVGYFLSAEAMAAVAQACAQTLAADGTLVACDWRPPFAERRLPTEQVHAMLADLGLHRLVLHDEADFLLQVWTRDARSVAQRGGIR